ncbi:DUF2961 domain-containing protein [bacterium]|nr:DUF2961 domain-containing protein [bacterium]
MHRLAARAIVIGLSAAACLAPARAQTRDLGWFLHNLHSLEDLPALEDSHTSMESTWDRSGGNRDGHDYKRLAGDRNILLDVDGPGCLHRVFTGVVGAALEGTSIRFFFDGETAPRLDMPANRFFDPVDGPFPWPLAFNGRGPSRGITYPGVLFPIPFEKHLRVELVHPDAETLRDEKRPDVPWGNYWQLTYTRYPAGTPVQTLRWPLSDEETDQVGQVCTAWRRAVGGAPEVEKWTRAQSMRLARGESAEIRFSGSGVIRQLRLAAHPATRDRLLALRLKMYWDGETSPSVDVPAGRFFGHGDYGHDLRSLFSSLLVGVEHDEAWCALPMPFARGARIVLEYQGAGELSVVVKAQTEKRRSLPDNWGRLAATYRTQRIGSPDNPTFGPKNVPGHVLLDVTGRGKYVGNFLFIDWPSEIWWGEGDWLIWSDEDAWPPSYHGTGSEEYYNSGWCVFDRKAVSGFVRMRPGRVGVYSFHLNDAFNFRKNIRVVEEMMPWNTAQSLIEEKHPLWESTAFWYRAR